MPYPALPPVRVPENYWRRTGDWQNYRDESDSDAGDSSGDDPELLLPNDGQAIFRGADAPPDGRVEYGRRPMPSDTERAATQHDLHGRDEPADRDITSLRYAYAERWQWRMLDDEPTHPPEAENVPEDGVEWRQCLICSCYEPYRYTAAESCCNEQRGGICAYVY